jgi:superfamily II DNA or RNA helicase
MRSIFDVVDYQFILGLTATLERLDGKEVIIKKHCPVIDEITIDLATENG